jgi:hypothetical protein
MPILIENLESDVKLNDSLILTIPSFGNDKYDELINFLFKNLKQKLPDLFISLNNFCLSVCDENLKKEVEKVITRVSRKYYKFPIKESDFTVNKQILKTDYKPLILTYVNTFGNKSFPKMYKELMSELHSEFKGYTIIISTDTINYNNEKKYKNTVEQILNNTLKSYYI